MFTFTSTRTDDPVAAAALASYFAERSETFPQSQGAYSVRPPVPEGFIPPAGDFVVLSIDGRPMGCGGVRRIADGRPTDASSVSDAASRGRSDRVDGARTSVTRYEIKHLWLDPTVRGRGAGRALLNELERRAIGLGADRIVLDTNESLTAAGNLYRTSGYVSTAPYNDNPNATHWYAKDVAPPAS
jgi:ribosomal protein S18 acetylase RimI-like enzyme